MSRTFFREFGSSQIFSINQIIRNKTNTTDTIICIIIKNTGVVSSLRVKIYCSITTIHFAECD